MNVTNTMKNLVKDICIKNNFPIPDLNSNNEKELLTILQEYMLRPKNTEIDYKQLSYELGILINRFTTDIFDFEGAILSLVNLNTIENKIKEFGNYPIYIIEQNNKINVITYPNPKYTIDESILKRFDVKNTLIYYKTLPFPRSEIINHYLEIEDSPILSVFSKFSNITIVDSYMLIDHLRKDIKL